MGVRLKENYYISAGIVIYNSVCFICVLTYKLTILGIVLHYIHSLNAIRLKFIHIILILARTVISLQLHSPDCASDYTIYFVAVKACLFKWFLCFILHFNRYYAALLPRRGPHIASHSVCLSVRLSVRPSVQLSLPSVTSFRQPLASRMYFSARTEGRISYGHLGRTNSCFLLCILVPK